MGSIGNSAAAAADHIRPDCVTTLVRPVSQQFQFWRDLMSPLMEIEQKKEAEEGLRCKARGYDLGTVLLTVTNLDSLNYRRDEDLIRRSGIDHWCMSILKQGQDIGRSAKRVLQARSGTIRVKSLAYPFEGCHSRISEVALFLPRDNFASLSDRLDGADHTLILGPMGQILKECLLALEEWGPRMTVADVATLTRVLTQLINAAIKPSPDNVAAARQPTAGLRFNMARKYIEDNLSSPYLGPSSLSAALGVSRRLLYYLFEPQGGVAKFILKRRLAACCKAIADQADHRLISTIAYSYGFNDPALFSRQFHAEYGFRPTDARAARRFGHAPHSSAPHSLADWFLQERKT
ncbi:Helix-turn-helix, AraC domain-containing protein [Rhizobium sp. PDO1-076]|uniref:helix-turn-helix domain-containing protein n=1 Tax=Rhizobium sp. PDO1-076 TaxID=1125979 RepID=UPI00024E2969|nr:helix-turn-helix domain-containing protein [Rhizobium sp. PDO1-076]EHS51778.1 Helix-turn-helix, AraC domain-containing protein [Rhizobium sp. PDO1-076]